MTASLLSWLLIQSSGCTLIGRHYGRVMDERALRGIAFRPARAARLKPGTPVVITFRDGTAMKGTLAGASLSDTWTDSELRSLYPAGVDSNGGTRLPLPGDTLLVTTANARGWARFARFENEMGRGTDDYVAGARAAALFQLGAARTEMSFPLASLKCVQWPDSTISTGEQLARLLTSLRVPTYRKPADRKPLMVRTMEGDTLALPFGQVDRVEASLTTYATDTWTLIGFALDCGFVWFLHYLYTSTRFA